MTCLPEFRGEENRISKPRNLCGNEVPRWPVPVSGVREGCVYNRLFDLCDGELLFFFFKPSEGKKSY